MAVEDKLSTALTNVATQKANNSFFERGTVYVSSGKATIAAADDDGSKYRIARLPVNARIISILRHHAAVTSGTDYDLGAYLKDTGAVVDKDSLSDGLDLSAASAVKTESLGKGITAFDPEKRLWELQAGVSTDPQKSGVLEYEIVLTANTVGSAAVVVGFDILWTY